MSRPHIKSLRFLALLPVRPGSSPEGPTANAVIACGAPGPGNPAVSLPLFWNGEESGVPVKVELDLSGLKRGWEVVREDTLGEVYLALLCQHPADRGDVDLDNPMALAAMW